MTMTDKEIAFKEIARSTVEKTAVDLHHLNLSGIDLHSVNLHCANLHCADLAGVNLAGVNLYRANLYGTDLTGTDLTGANLGWANLHSANLHYADLHRADLGWANLYGTNLAGINLAGANLRGTCLDPSNCPSGATLEKWDHATTRSGVVWVRGYRTLKSTHTELRKYVSGFYKALIFSIAPTECHPGLYLFPTLGQARNWAKGAPVIAVETLASEIHEVGDKVRCRWFIAREIIK